MVTPADIAIALGLPIPDGPQFAQWQMWIDDALMLLRFGDGVHAGLGDLALLDQVALAYVVREAVKAHVLRPDDSTQVDVSVDDARVSRRYSTGKGRVGILSEWWAMLSPVPSGVGAWTIRPYGAPDYCGGGWERGPSWVTAPAGMPTWGAGATW